MKKIYCKNCKYNGGTYDWGRGWNWCECLQAKIDVRKKLEKRKLYKPFSEFANKAQQAAVIEKSELNHEGECKYYQKKWWKFKIK